MSSRTAPTAAGEACSRPHCPGRFSDWDIVHPLHRGDQTIIVEGVPALVCFTCGETRISDETFARIEALLEEHPVTGTIPFREWRD